MTVKRHKPRINVTIDQDQFEVLEAYSEVTGASMSALIRQMLREIQPALIRTTQAMKLAKSNDPRAQEMMRALIEETNQEAQKSMQELETAGTANEAQGKCSECGRTGLMTPESDICHPCRMVMAQQQSKKAIKPRKTKR